VIITVQQSAFSDFEALKHGMQDAPLDVMQVEPGPMSGKLAHMSIGSVGISTGSFSHGIRTRGVLSKTRFTLGMVFVAPALQHFEMAPGDLITVKPGQETYSRYFGANSYAGVLIEPGKLFEKLNREPGAFDALSRVPTALLTADDRASAVVRTRELCTLFAETAKDGPTMPVVVADYYQRRIIALLIAPLIDRVGDRYRGPHVRSAVTLVRNADAFISDAGHRPIHSSELCELLNVSERTLQRAFLEVHDLSPMTYLRCHAHRIAGGE